MKITRIYIITLSMLCTSLFSQNNTSINDNKYNIKSINKLRLGVIYSNFSSKNFNDETIPGFVAYNSYLIQSKHNLNYGIGTGFELYKKQLFLPTYMNLLTYIHKNLFLDTQAGYAFGWKRKSVYYENYTFNGGFYGSLGTGYKYKLNNEINFCLEISYSYQQASLKSGSQPNNSVHFHSILFTFGLFLD